MMYEIYISFNKVDKIIKTGIIFKETSTGISLDEFVLML